METPGLRVTAARVHHPPLQDAYAYRFDTSTRSFVLSGDTSMCLGLVELARRADVLVHEVMRTASIPNMVARQPNARELHAHLMASHTTTEEVGIIAARAQVSMLVLNHFVPGDDSSISDEMWLVSPRASFGGPVVASHDLLVI
jgi:ribonuclease BN (tRNA processing enzyme)